MKKSLDFASAFKGDFLEYVGFMVGNGRSFGVDTSILKAFDRFLCVENCVIITDDVAMRFVYQPKGLTQTQYRKRHSIVRRFAEYRALRGSSDFILPPLKVKTSARLIPHLYSDAEIALILDIAGKLKPQDSLRPYTYQAIIGLLSCTGMRISEILNLNCDDVDLEAGVLFVHNSKFRKSRLIPVHATTLVVLGRYARQRSQCFPSPQCDAFFLNNRGIKVAYSTFCATFLEIVREAGIRPAEDKGSRIHDLRHTFAVNRLSVWYDQGANIHDLLPVLSTYMGHAHFEDTVYYLHVSAELMSKGSRSFQPGGDSDA